MPTSSAPTSAGSQRRLAVEVGARAVREDVRVLEQQQVLLAPAIEQGLLDRQRLPIGDRAEPADAEHQTSSDQSFVSRISLIRRRNPAA